MSMTAPTKDEAPNFLVSRESFGRRQTSWDRDVWQVIAKVMEKMMKRTLIRYRTKPDMADKNAELIAAVFAELKAAKPEGIRYLSLRLEGDMFIHVVATPGDDGRNGLTRPPAVQPLQSGA